MFHRPRISTLFPYTTLFRSVGFDLPWTLRRPVRTIHVRILNVRTVVPFVRSVARIRRVGLNILVIAVRLRTVCGRSEEHTSELQSLRHLVCRLLLEKKNRLY